MKYRIYFMGSRTLESPPDEITIDTNLHMTFLTQQQMQDGRWRQPKGIAMLEPADQDSLEAILHDSELYTMKQEDVYPLCPEGSEHVYRIERKDKDLLLAIKTNTCAKIVNSLNSRQRVLLRRLIDYFEKLRKNYRPQFTEDRRK